MESGGRNKQEKSKFPMIIAMKGPSSSEKREISRKLAASLQYPLIDEEDIIPSLQSFIPTSSSNSSNILSDKYSNGLPFKIVAQISSTQLDSKLRVIVSTPLANFTEFQQLVGLALSKGASLVIVQCGSQDNDGYDVGGVSKLSIDTTKPFIVEEFVPKMIKMAESSKEIDLGALEADLSKGLSSKKTFSDGDDKNMIETKFAEKHAHEFFFIADPEVIGIGDKMCCYCKKSITEATYKCTECDDFVLHKTCAELLDRISAIKENCPTFLRKNPRSYKFPKKYKCTDCEKFSKSCTDCLFQTHIRIGSVPTILHFAGHEHPLNFVIMPLWFDYQYKCCECDEMGKSISFKCFRCNFDLHIECALPPPPPPPPPPSIGWSEPGSPLLLPRRSATLGPLTQEQIEQILKRFDANGDSVLSKEEVKQAFKYLGIRYPEWRASRAIRHADIDGSGAIDNSELKGLANYVFEHTYK